jgi:hypothetical protein
LSPGPRTSAIDQPAPGRHPPADQRASCRDPNAGSKPSPLHPRSNLDERNAHLPSEHASSRSGSRTIEFNVGSTCVHAHPLRLKLDLFKGEPTKRCPGHARLCHRPHLLMAILENDDPYHTVWVHRFTSATMAAIRGRNSKTTRPWAWRRRGGSRVRSPRSRLTPLNGRRDDLSLLLLIAARDCWAKVSGALPESFRVGTKRTWLGQTFDVARGLILSVAHEP